eukprot:TRINITY_DN75997_c0_g1_i1.p1 TRINITY_DN75997_c0_g1~~TRINITY_DN75997_c0_g1_i1.p1  ORF type:complete len:583 (-),score=85.29 TRINITY_DN75997_c0_g1_i1:1009-2757(-)
METHSLIRGGYLLAFARDTNRVQRCLKELQWISWSTQTRSWDPARDGNVYPTEEAPLIGEANEQHPTKQRRHFHHSKTDSSCSRLIPLTSEATALLLQRSEDSSPPCLPELFWRDLAPMLADGSVVFVHDFFHAETTFGSKAQCLGGNAKMHVQSKREIVFSFVDVFSGMGGFRVALEGLGGTCMGSCEIDSFAHKTYELNFGGNASALHGDLVWTINNQGNREFFQRDITRLSGEHFPNDLDVLTGGFPCQSFSTLGEHKGANDPRGQVFFHLLRLIRESKPKFFILENVRGLILLNDGTFVKEIVGLLEGLGYKVSYEVIGAELLLPQRRPRVYFVGVRDDIVAKGFMFSFDFLIKSLPKLDRRLRDVLEEDVEPKYFLNDNQWGKVKENAQKYVIANPDGSGKLVSGKEVVATLMSSYRKSWLKHSQFVVPIGQESTAPGTEIGVELLPEKQPEDVVESGCGDLEEVSDEPTRVVSTRSLNNPRFFTARECCRLQGFPETWRIPGEKDGSLEVMSPELGRFYRQVGNAVAPPVVVAVAWQLADFLKAERQLERIGFADAVLQAVRAAAPTTKPVIVVEP